MLLTLKGHLIQTTLAQVVSHVVCHCRQRSYPWCTIDPKMKYEKTRFQATDFPDSGYRACNDDWRGVTRCGGGIRRCDLAPSFVQWASRPHVMVTCQVGQVPGHSIPSFPSSLYVIPCCLFPPMFSESVLEVINTINDTPRMYTLFCDTNWHGKWRERKPPDRQWQKKVNETEIQSIFQRRSQQLNPILCLCSSVIFSYFSTHLPFISPVSAQIVLSFHVSMCLSK